MMLTVILVILAVIAIGMVFLMMSAAENEDHYEEWKRSEGWKYADAEDDDDDDE